MDGDATANDGPTAGRWWGPTAAAASSASTDVMNQLCRVCGEPAAGFHFGAFTCEGCKSFFGRTYNNISSISECKNNGECVINKKNRTSCKACRLRKCLLVGMSKSGSRYGRRSNWFKIHCLLQEQQQQAGSNAALRDPMATKNKVLPLWDGFPQHFLEKQSHHLPTMIDADNNNTGPLKEGFVDNKNRTHSPSHLMPVRTLPPSTHSCFGSANEAAAALWAARNSLLPLQMSAHHHMGTTSLPSLQVPFLTSPYLQGAGFQPHCGPPPNNFILPFVQSMTSAKPFNTQRHVSTPSTSISSTSSPPSSPLQEQKQATSESSKSEHRFNVSCEKTSSYDKSVAILQSLGPMQEQPIDLSLRGNAQNVNPKCERQPRGHSSSEDTTEHEEMSSDSEEDAGSCGGERAGGSQGLYSANRDRKPTKTPLDLTTRT